VLPDIWDSLAVRIPNNIMLLDNIHENYNNNSNGKKSSLIGKLSILRFFVIVVVVDNFLLSLSYFHINGLAACYLKFKINIL